MVGLAEIEGFAVGLRLILGFGVLVGFAVSPGQQQIE